VFNLIVLNTIAYNKSPTMAALTINIPKNAEFKEDFRKMSKMDSFVLQHTSAQDVALHGSTPKFDYLVVSDGHGSGMKKHVLREFIKTLDWDVIFQDKNWYKNDVDSTGDYNSLLFRSLHSGLDAFSDKYNTKQGCTLSVVLIYKDRFECFTIGDSTIKIWENRGETWAKIAETVDHDINFLEDVQRLEQRRMDDAMFTRISWKKQGIKIPNGVLKKNIWRMKPVSATSITMEPSAYFYFDDTSSLNMTRSLGHYPTRFLKNHSDEKNHKMSLAEQSLTKMVISREPGKKYIILACTDGVWDVTAHDKEASYIDMISKGAKAETIVTEVKKCWCQSWDYVFEGKPSVKTSIPNDNHDDIGCAFAFIR